MLPKATRILSAERTNSAAGGGKTRGRARRPAYAPSRVSLYGFLCQMDRQLLYDYKDEILGLYLTPKSHFEDERTVGRKMLVNGISPAWPLVLAKCVAFGLRTLPAMRGRRCRLMSQAGKWKHIISQDRGYHGVTTTDVLF